jgi:hypothetical protein
VVGADRVGGHHGRGRADRDAAVLPGTLTGGSCVNAETRG